MARVLVVEDYPNLQKLYLEALQREGFEVMAARDGDEALAIAREHEPDLILLDLLLPKRGGLEFLRAYNAEKFSHVKVIVFSNMASPELAKEAEALGAAEYLLKSEYTPKEIAEVVKKQLAV
jgi:CheY-like chemotaxis protein